jgi:chromosome segregation ATPase
MTKLEFEKLQLLLQDRSHHRRRDVESTYLFQGVLICPNCGNPLSVNRYVRKRKDGSQYQGAVYKCQACYKAGNSMIQIGEHRFLDALYEYMKNIDIKDLEPIEDKGDDELNKYKKQLAQIEKQRERYQRAWATGRMLDKEFDKLMDETLDVYQELVEKINALEETAPTITKEEIFRLLTTDEKREFISRFFRKVEFYLVPKPPLRPDKAKKGKDLVVIFNVEFY